MVLNSIVQLNLIMLPSWQNSSHSGKTQAMNNANLLEVSCESMQVLDACEEEGEAYYIIMVCVNKVSQFM